MQKPYEIAIYQINSLCQQTNKIRLVRISVTTIDSFVFDYTWSQFFSSLAEWVIRLKVKTMDRVGIESEKKVTSWMGICLPRQQSKHNHIQITELSCELLKLEWSVVFVLVVGHMGLNVLVANHFHTELLSGIKNAPLRGGLKKLIKFSIKG